MNKLNGLNRKGFTLIEVIVVAAIIAILAGILVPMIFSQIDESKVAKAKGDAKTIQTAIMMFRKDNSFFPNRTVGTDATTNTLQVLTSEGTAIADLVTRHWDGERAHMLDHLRENLAAYPVATWKGPYLPDASADPWGNRYMVGAKNFENNLPVWILSAGPNGLIETDIDADALGGDDIGIRFK